MATTDPSPENILRFSGQEDIERRVQQRLKRRYGQGIHIHDYRESPDGTIFIRIGNTVPKDVSDSREPDRALKFIKYAPIYTIEADSTKNGYVISLPDRSELYEGYQEQKRDLASRLDRSMAKTTYEQLVEFTPVENQLAAIKDILRTVREFGPVTLETIHADRGPRNTEQTDKYLRLLADTEFIRIQDDTVSSGANLDVHDEKDVGSKEFSKLVLGQVVNRAYHTLKDELNMTLLAHYPRYANAYYFSAVEKGDPELRLDAEAAKTNLADLYDLDAHWITVQKKLEDLADVGIIQQENRDYFCSDQEVYDNMQELAAV